MVRDSFYIERGAAVELKENDIVVFKSTNIRRIKAWKLDVSRYILTVPTKQI